MIAQKGTQWLTPANSRPGSCGLAQKLFCSTDTCVEVNLETAGGTN
jgi:hypothetical protein